MKTKKAIWSLMLVAAVAFTFLQSCSKSDEGSMSDTDLGLAKDDAYADALFEEVDNMVISEVTTLDDNHYSTLAMKSTEEDDDCFTVVVDHPDSVSFPKVITLDYGTGCTIVFNRDTITRKGKIIITISDRWFVPGAEHSVTFSDFYLNDVKIEGTRTITNLGINEARHLELGIRLTDGKITFNDTLWMTREADHVREWIRGFNPIHDSILITGTANGTNIRGEVYQREITEPLVLVHCSDYQKRWVIVDGKVEITNSVSGITTIDYDANGCDGIVVINKNGHHRNWEFKYTHRNNWRNQ